MRNASADGGPVEVAKATPDTEQIIRQTIEHLQRQVRLSQAVLFGFHVRAQVVIASKVYHVIVTDFDAHWRAEGS